MAKKKYVYFFGNGRAEGRSDMKELLGGKGAGLAEMTNVGLPVPAGFTITTEVCDAYYKNNKKYPSGLKQEVEKNLKRLEKLVNKTLGDPNDPLLVSVRSGAARSMPGMMETILNLGLNDRSVEGLAKKTNNRRFVLDAYRRFITMYGSTAMGVAMEKFEEELELIKETRTRVRLGVRTARVFDTDVNEAELTELIPRLKQVFKANTGKDFPQDPLVQLWGAIEAVVGSWMADKAVTYRRVEKINGLKGTAVNIVQMVFGNMGENSGTGVCFTRDPNTGAKLEKHNKDMQDIEFTIEEGKLYILQTRSGKRSPNAAFKMAVDMVKEGLITKNEALLRISTQDIERLFYPVIDPKIDLSELKAKLFATGIAAVPGAASGSVVMNAKDAEDWAVKGKNVILVRKETRPA